MSDVSVIELDNLSEQAFLLKARCEKIQEQLDVEKAQLRDVEAKILNHLEHHNKKSWDSEYGEVQIRERLSVKTPKDESDKRAFFKWLEDKGVFWVYASVNSQSLNALYNAEADSCAESGKEFNIPGLTEPTLYKSVTLKRK